MLCFTKPHLDDRNKVCDILHKSDINSCEFSFGNLFCWNGFFELETSICDNLIICKAKNCRYTFPKGYGDKISAIKKIIEHCNHTIVLYGATKEDCNFLDENFKGMFSFKEDRDSFDYIYLRDDLAYLPGKKYHQKRNHIAYFENNNLWKYEEISRDNLQECIDMNEVWYKENKEKGNGIDIEHDVLTKAFNNFEELEYSGGIIRSYGKIVAFTMGEELNNDVYCTHFEKAFSSVRGAYPIINREFALNSLSKYKYINREDDVGSEGLRKSKLSYHPAILLDKYTATEIK